MSIAMTPPPRPTAHACLRYAQRVLGMTVDELQLRADWALRRRCERGIDRLMERAVRARQDGRVEIWVARTRTMIVQDAHVITLLVAPSSKRFGKRRLSKAPTERRAAAGGVR
jgi:hypothetical protein